jgi:hypothetical protein
VRKRYSFLRQQWIPADSFTAEDEQAIPSEKEYRTTLAAGGPIHMPYIASGSDMGNI